MANKFEKDTWRELMRRMENMKAKQRMISAKPASGVSKPPLAKLQPIKLPRITIPKPTAIASKSGIRNMKSANMFYTKPVNGGTISSSIKPVKPPVSNIKPASLAQLRKEIEAQQKALAKINKQQYNEMLAGGKTDMLEALKVHREAALKELQAAYAQAMGLEEKRPKASVKATPQNEKSFWAGFRKGLGLKEGEEVGSGRPGELSFAAQNVAAHMPGLDDEDTGQSSEADGQFSSFVYGYSGDNPLLEDEEDAPEPGPNAGTSTYGRGRRGLQCE